jgi:hypothetical protein
MIRSAVEKSEGRIGTFKVGIKAVCGHGGCLEVLGRGGLIFFEYLQRAGYRAHLLTCI